MERFYRRLLLQIFYMQCQLFAQSDRLVSDSDSVHNLHAIIIRADLQGDLMAKDIKNYLKNDPQALNLLDDNCRTPLNLAIMYDRDLVVIKTLLEQGADVNTPNLFNVTPLHLAVSHNQGDIVPLLLAYGANKNFKNDDNQTPVDIDYGNNLVKLT